MLKKRPKFAQGGPPEAPKLAPKSAPNRPRTLSSFFKIPFGTALCTPGASGASGTSPGTPPGPLREPPGSLPGAPRDPPGDTRDASETPPGPSGTLSRESSGIGSFQRSLFRSSVSLLGSAGAPKGIEFRTQIFDFRPVLGRFGPRDPFHRIPSEIWRILVP